jgi:hypothetical protein
MPKHAISEGEGLIEYPQLPSLDPQENFRLRLIYQRRIAFRTSYALRMDAICAPEFIYKSELASGARHLKKKLSIPRSLVLHAESPDLVEYPPSENVEG